MHEHCPPSGRRWWPYRVTPVAVAQFRAGSLTTVRESTANGQVVASAAVQSAVSGAVATFVQ